MFHNRGNFTRASLWVSPSTDQFTCFSSAADVFPDGEVFTRREVKSCREVAFSADADVFPQRELRREVGLCALTNDIASTIAQARNHTDTDHDCCHHSDMKCANVTISSAPGVGVPRADPVWGGAENRKKRRSLCQKQPEEIHALFPEKGCCGTLRCAGLTSKSESSAHHSLMNIANFIMTGHKLKQSANIFNKVPSTQALMPVTQKDELKT